MKHIFTVFCALTFLSLQVAVAQVQVQGTVTDAGDEQPFPGVQINVKGTLIGTTTDVNGAFFDFSARGREYARIPLCRI